MDYSKHYTLLMNKNAHRVKDTNLYLERHHIIPKCMGGTDDATNLVYLLPEEHFVAHQLLYKMYPANRIIGLALHMMCNGRKKYIRNNKKYKCIRNQYADNMSGENNPSAKFTNRDVIDIYYSDEHMDILAERYGVKRYNITTIKRKISYRSVTEHITDLPGYCKEDTGKGKNIPIPIDLIEHIFYDSGTYEYFWNTYRATRNVVVNIKRKISNKSITQKLGEPGQVIRYNLTNDNLEEIHISELTDDQLALKFNVCVHTIRNIKNGRTRGIFIDNF